MVKCVKEKLIEKMYALFMYNIRLLYITLWALYTEKWIYEHYVIIDTHANRKKIGLI